MRPAHRAHGARRALQLVMLALLAASQATADDGGEPTHATVSRGALTIIAPESLEAQATSLAARGEELLPSIEHDLNQQLLAPLTMVLIPARVPDEFAVLDQRSPPWASGFLFPERRLGAIRMDRVTTYPFDGAEMVLAHEMAHQVIHDKVGRALPRWFEEAVATQIGRRRGARDLLYFASTTLFRSPPSLAAVNRGFAGNSQQADLAYAVSFEFLSWANRTYRSDLAAAVIEKVAERQRQPSNPLDLRTDFEAAWQDTTGVPLEISEQRWRQRWHGLRRWIPLLLNSNWLWVGMAVLSIVAFLVKRRNKLERYRQWEAQEAEAARMVVQSDDTDSESGDRLT